MLTLTRPEAAALLQEAEAALRSGAFESAVEHSAMAIAADPKNGRAHFINGQAHLSAKNFSAAERAYKKSIELGFTPAACYFGLGAAQSVNGYYSAAVKQYTLALGQSGCTEELRLEIYHQLALLHIQLGDFAAALRWFGKEETVPVPNAHMSESLGHMLSIHAAAGETQAALLCIGQLLVLHPEDWLYHHIKINLLIQSGTPQALADAADALKKAEVLCTAPALQQEHLADAALLESALAEQEQDPAAAARFEEAIRLLQRAAAVPGTDAAVRAGHELAAAELMLRQEQKEQALACAVAVAHRDTLPAEVRAHAAFLAAELLFALGREAEAAACVPLLKAAAAGQYKNHGMYLAWRLAESAAEKQRAYQLAEAQLRKAAAEHDPTAMIDRIKLAAEAKDFTRARRLLKSVSPALAAELEEYITRCEEE